MRHEAQVVDRRQALKGGFVGAVQVAQIAARVAGAGEAVALCFHRLGTLDVLIVGDVEIAKAAVLAHVEPPAAGITRGQGAVEDAIAKAGAGGDAVRVADAQRVHGKLRRNQRPRQAQQLAEQQRLVQQSRTTEQSWQQQTRTSQAAPVQAQPRQSKPASTQQPYQDLLQTPAHTTAQSKPQQAAPVARAADAPKPTAEKKDERRWMVQCGSFRGAEQAETVRAQLAFEGFDSKITTNNGWNRVVIGPVKGKENADSTLNRLKMAGHTNCIRLATGG